MKEIKSGFKITSPKGKTVFIRKFKPKKKKGTTINLNYEPTNPLHDRSETKT